MIGQSSTGNGLAINKAHKTNDRTTAKTSQGQSTNSLSRSRPSDYKGNRPRLAAADELRLRNPYSLLKNRVFRQSLERTLRREDRSLSNLDLFSLEPLTKAVCANEKKAPADIDLRLLGSRHRSISGCEDTVTMKWNSIRNRFALLAAWRVDP